jgi:hypothetical protein
VEAGAGVTRIVEGLMQEEHLRLIWVQLKWGLELECWKDLGRSRDPPRR